MFFLYHAILTIPIVNLLCFSIPFYAPEYKKPYPLQSNAASKAYLYNRLASIAYTTAFNLMEKVNLHLTVESSVIVKASQVFKINEFSSPPRL